MKSVALFWPRWRAVGVGSAALVMGIAGIRMGVPFLGWSATGLFTLIAVTSLFALASFLRDLRRPLTRTLIPAQFQVGYPTSSMFQSPAGDPATMISDYLPESFTRTRTTGGEVLVPNRRGIVHLGPAMRRGADPFGLFSWRTRAAKALPVTVWPRVDSLPRDAITDLIRHASAAAGAPIARIDDLALRDYQLGDPISRIDWKRSAAHAGILVRQAEPEQAQTVDLILSPGSEPDTDRGIDLLAAAAFGLNPFRQSLRFLAGETIAIGSYPTLLTAMAQALPAKTMPAQNSPGLAVIALADPSAAGASEVVQWVARGGADPARVVVLAWGPLTPALRALLAPFNLVEI